MPFQYEHSDCIQIARMRALYPLVALSIQLDLGGSSEEWRPCRVPAASDRSVTHVYPMSAPLSSAKVGVIARLRCAGTPL